MFRNKSKQKQKLSITAKASHGKDATSGRIIVQSGDKRKEIPAVIFTQEQAEKIFDSIEAAYSA